MYAYIRGIVDDVDANRVVIEANGIGYELICSKRTLASISVGKEAKLLTYFHLSQDAIALYGFSSNSERSMFKQLLSVSRIGPKVALSVLSNMAAEDVKLAVMTDNVAAFDHVSGMGRKTAARVILELKEKIDFKAETTFSFEVTDKAANVSSMRADTIAALVSLGYDGIVAGRTVASLPECERTEEMLKLALKQLSKNMV